MVVVPMRMKYRKPIGGPARAARPAAATLAAAARTQCAPGRGRALRGLATWRAMRGGARVSATAVP